MPTFKEMNLKPEIQNALESLGFMYPTEIQKKAIPLLLSEKKIDFHGQAQTGTGKTLAFVLPLINKINIELRKPQALIIAPTRELAIQIYESIRLVSKNLKITTALIYGGVSMDEQIRILRSGAQVIVGTPGRIKDHISRKTMNLSQINTLVLDEADIMLDMGFKEEIEDILNHCPDDREIWLFSATVKSGIEDIKRSHMSEPVVVQVSRKQVTTEKTEQFYSIVPFKSRLHAVTRFIQSASEFYGIIFCQTKILASEVADELTKRGYSVGALHGDMSQAQRNLVIKKFKQKEFTILVATDVAARGIDVANLTHVINYSLPEDLESYVHRIGRTGRAGKKGTAITFIIKGDLRSVSRIERQFGVKLLPIDVPSTQMLINNAIKEISQFIKTQTQVDQATELEQLDKVDKVKSTEIDAVYRLLDNLSQEQLIKIAGNLLYKKFLSTLDLEEIPYVHVDQELDELQEICINLGSEDNINKEDIIKYLMDTGIVKEDQIKKIRIINRRSYVKLSADCSPELLTALHQRTLKGLKARVNLTCYVNDAGSSRRSGSGSRYGSGSRPRSRSDYSSRERSRSGSDRSRRRSR
ncbi:DEAD/DEAH box helicase [Candidatus Babela massiliensis]|uniref:Superfamily II DNA and RNA helicase n=1 Tax=Candidatus Babela massiliensis TaxID=673862 RepID=V6DH74_9BACT|nr:DEAD/DEAH box helicase [Candidatus Babela massiliensis]CDK30894.1 Superfamily II DNA and RNA helicase [Candidatus Babela massiliensis]